MNSYTYIHTHTLLTCHREIKRHISFGRYVGHVSEQFLRPLDSFHESEGSYSGPEVYIIQTQTAFRYTLGAVDEVIQLRMAHRRKVRIKNGKLMKSYL